MIRSRFKYQNDLIHSIEVSGHAFYADYGNDIVCAAVSTALIVTANAIESLKLDQTIDLIVTEGYFKLKVLEKNDTVSALLNNLEYSLLNLEKQYPKNIKNQKEG